MADIDDKEYSRLKEDLENMGTGADKYQTTPDPDHPLPSNITKTRYDDAEEALSKAWNKAQDLQTQTNRAFDDYQLVFDATDKLKNGDSRTVKGIFGIYSENLRDFGIKPEKKRGGGGSTPPPVGP